MTQIVVTLEEGSDLSIIRSAINLIRGVKDTVVTHTEPKRGLSKIDKRLQAFDRLAGSISMDKIDMDDPRTQYILRQ